MPFRRDPISVYYDRQALKALRSAERRRGRWVDVNVPQLSPRASVACLRAGINPYGDDGSGRGVSRTVRGFVRSLYNAHRKDDTHTGLWLAWRNQGAGLGGWQVAIMLDRAGSPAIPARRDTFSWPAHGIADPTRRDWGQ